MQAEFERHGLGTVRRLPLFVAPPPSESVARGDEGPLVFLGRLAATKGVELMLDAVRSARRALGEPLPLILLGDGSLRDRVEQAVTKSGEQFTFRGWVSTTERDQVLRSARLLLVPSVWPEPFGLAGLEAGRFGVPAVAFGWEGSRSGSRTASTACCSTRGSSRRGPLPQELFELSRSSVAGEVFARGEGGIVPLQDRDSR